MWKHPEVAGFCFKKKHPEKPIAPARGDLAPTKIYKIRREDLAVTWSSIGVSVNGDEKLGQLMMNIFFC